MAGPSILTDSLEAFFDRNPFAETATLSNGVAVFVQFSSPFQMSDALSVKYDAQLPTGLFKASDVSAVARGDTLTIRGATYHVVGVEPSNAGTTILVLSLNPEN